MTSTIDPSATYDIVCVGFGTKGLAISTILADHNPSQKVLVIERNEQFSSGLSSAFPDHGMASTFLRDLITLRNPRSLYTFINFLHSSNLLIDFTNVSQLATTRRLATQYLQWVADQIERLGWVRYGKEVVNITPARSSSDGMITRWNVDLRANGNGAASKVSCKRIIIATSGATKLPDVLSSPRIAPHTFALDRAMEFIERINAASNPMNIVILGADQEAVELFEHIMGIPGGHRVKLMFEGSALRAVDATPFAQELIDGAHSSNLSLHHLPPELRQKIVSTVVSAAYPTVDLHLLESIYAQLYTQRISSSDTVPSRFSIHPQTRIQQAIPEGDGVRLIYSSNQAASALPNLPASSDQNEHIKSEILDLIIVSPQSANRAGSNLLSPLFRSLDAQSNIKDSSSPPSSSWTVDASYKLNFRRNLLSPGCGIWLLGSLTGTHARKTDLSILSASAGRAVDDILAEAKKEGMALKDGRGQAALL